VPAPRVPLVAGNWKMNPTSQEAAVGLARSVADSTARLPVIFLGSVAAAVGGGTTQPGGIGIGAQTMHAADSGAFTGEISPLMLRGVAQYVIVGHSERREYASETDEACAAKVASAVAHGLVPIAAIGESADERRAGVAAEVIERQLRAAISQLEGIVGSGLVIAYEPVWAIGTGDAATADDAQQAAGQIRAILQAADPDGADEVPILYGGSCTPQNAPEFFGMPDIDGALVGGASLDAESFAAIVRTAADLRG
jgi:triosephosphate isomerase